MCMLCACCTETAPRYQRAKDFETKRHKHRGGEREKGEGPRAPGAEGTARRHAKEGHPSRSTCPLPSPDVPEQCNAKLPAKAANTLIHLSANIRCQPAQEAHPKPKNPDPKPARRFICFDCSQFAGGVARHKS